MRNNGTICHCDVFPNCIVTFASEWTFSIPDVVLPRTTHEFGFPKPQESQNTIKQPKTQQDQSGLVKESGPYNGRKKMYETRKKEKNAGKTDFAGEELGT